MASIRKRGSNSYLIVVSRGYDYEGNRLKSVQKTVKPPKEYTPKQAEKWVKEQAILFEREVQHTPEPINRSITLAKYIEHWVTDVGPKKLADSTFRRDEQDIRRILPALGNYKLTDLRKEVIREFYEETRHTPRLDGRGNLSEKSVEGLHNTLCGILSAAVDEGYLTHNPAWRCYKPKGQKKERPVADEETVKKLITAFEGQSMKYETYFKLVLATGLRRGEACGLKWSDINWRKRTIHVQRGVVKLSHQESITKAPKTASGDRLVYLSKEMCQLLKAWRKECEWDREQTANETVSEDDYLFRQPNGKPMNPCTFTYRFKLILKANNLPLDLNVHSLRHTNASLLIAQGVDLLHLFHRTRHLPQMTADDLKSVGKRQQQRHQIFPVPLHRLAFHAAFGGQRGDGELSGIGELRKKSGILPRTGQHTVAGCQRPFLLRAVFGNVGQPQAVLPQLLRKCHDLLLRHAHLLPVRDLVVTGIDGFQQCSSLCIPVYRLIQRDLPGVALLHPLIVDQAVANSRLQFRTFP